MNDILPMLMMLQGGGMGGMGQAQAAAPKPAPGMANPQMVTMGDQLRRSAAAGGGAPVSYQGGIIPMMANGQMGTIGNDLARLAGPDPMTDVPVGKLGWMDQFGKFLDGIDPNMRLMMGLQGAQGLGRYLGGGA
jgi:hypothetical protein